MGSVKWSTDRQFGQDCRSAVYLLAHRVPSAAGSLAYSGLPLVWHLAVGAASVDRQQRSTICTPLRHFGLCHRSGFPRTFSD